MLFLFLSFQLSEHMVPLVLKATPAPAFYKAFYKNLVFLMFLFAAFIMSDIDNVHNVSYFELINDPIGLTDLICPRFNSQ